MNNKPMSKSHMVVLVASKTHHMAKRLILIRCNKHNTGSQHAAGGDVFFPIPAASMLQMVMYVVHLEKRD